MKRITAILLILSSLTVTAAQYSKLSLITAAKSIGKWGEIKSFIASAGITDEWQSCSYLSDDHPLFATITNAVVVNGFATSAEVTAILEASLDPAVSDQFLRQAYNYDMQRGEGRLRWHGKVVTVDYDTNRLEKVTTYEDGYSHRTPFSSSHPGSIESQLSAAERAARAEAAKKERERLREEKRLARIAELQTNLTHCVQTVMRLKNWPEDLATLYLQHELNTLIGTNYVTVTVTPEP